MKRLKGKVAIVTGASSGIGRATAVLFAREGAKVAAVDIRFEPVQETAKLIRKPGDECIPVCADVSKAKDVRQMIETTVNSYGKLDILVNDAAIQRREGLIEDCKERVFNETIANDLKGVWLCMKYAIPEIRKAGGGSIVNISSISTFLGVPGIGAYTAAKGGVFSLTKGAAIEYADANIRVNCILPGHIGTEMFYDRTPPAIVEHVKATTFQRRLGRPKEVAQAILFLASEESSWITGTSLTADGGVSALLP